MKATGLLYCTGTEDNQCRHETNKPHWHRVYETEFEIPHENEKGFIDWDIAIWNEVTLGWWDNNN